MPTSNGPLTSSVDPTDIFDGLISEAEYAEQREVSVRTCQRDRQLRQAPPHIVLGKKIYYRVSSIRDWLIEHERCAERQAAAPRVKPQR